MDTAESNNRAAMEGKTAMAQFDQALFTRMGSTHSFLIAATRLLLIPGPL